MSEVEEMLKEAALAPRRIITKAAKDGAKIAMEKSKELLRQAPNSYTMTFKDGNTWSKQDIIDNLFIKTEKGKRVQKRVAQVNVKDWRVGLYSNFPEFGYTNPITGISHPATHFMRDGLTLSKREVEDAMLESVRKSLDKIRSK